MNALGGEGSARLVVHGHRRERRQGRGRVEEHDPEAARLGLDARTLADRHPALIAADLTRYGLSGPWSDRKAYDLLIQCEAGLVSLTGADEPGVRAGISIADIAAGIRWRKRKDDD